MSDLLIAGLRVSRETWDRLDAYAALLTKWNQRINLVAPATIPDLWERHIVDSAQVFLSAPAHARSWVDLGSGGGLPGLVCAILAREFHPETRFTLIDSDQRKAAFLSTAIHQLGLSARAIPKRTEQTAPQDAAVVTARALAPLEDLLPLVARHLACDGIAILLKGKNHAAELAAARQEWHFHCDARPSLTDSLSRVLVMKDIHRA